MALDPGPLLSLKQVAHLLGCSERQVQRLVTEKRLLPPMRVGKSPRWYQADVDAYLHLLGRGMWPDDLLAGEEGSLTEPDTP